VRGKPISSMLCALTRCKARASGSPICRMSMRRLRPTYGETSKPSQSSR
jgi:hypothetical protein